VTTQKISIRMKFDDLWRTPLVMLTPLNGVQTTSYVLTPSKMYWTGRTIDWETFIPVALEASIQWLLSETVDHRGWKFWAPNPKTTFRELDGISFGTSPGAEVDVPLN
jgi:hypothetical protein